VENQEILRELEGEGMARAEALAAVMTASWNEKGD
jgi:hypothetical protein